MSILAYLREFNFPSVVLRLALALAAGGVIGYGRARKRRNAGLRTYMLVSVGAALTILISLYETDMLYGPWYYVTQFVELKFDASRFSAQVINGIGFLAAGTIIGVAHQQISGLTSAIGLFTSACLGIAAGAGFYECVLPALLLIVFTMESLQPLEVLFKRRLRNITLCITFEDMDDIGGITETLLSHGATVFDIDMEDYDPAADESPSAIMTLKLERGNSSHSAILSAVAELSCVSSVQELIS